MKYFNNYIITKLNNIQVIIINIKHKKANELWEKYNIIIEPQNIPYIKLLDDI